MLNRLSRVFLASVLLGALAAAPAIAQDRPIDLSARGAQVYSGDGAGLTLPSQAAPAAVVAGFLRGRGLSDQAVGSLVLERAGPPDARGISHLRFSQSVGGLEVFGTYVKAAVDENGQLVHLIENLADPAGGFVLPAIVDESDVLEAAMQRVHPGVSADFVESGRSGNSVRFSGGSFFHRDPTVTRVAVAMNNGTLEEGFLVETWSEDDNLLHHTLVSGNGRILGVQLRTNNDSYNIFPDHPGNSAQTIVPGPGAGNAESPIGWLFATDQTTIRIRGNNVQAYLDHDNDNGPDAGGVLVGDDNFVTVADLGSDPTTVTNQAVAVQNLFYLNNVIHDTLYGHGFIESAGNFQEDNFGNGGAGGDSVNAEAQDGGGTNNANFATPSDGSNPRMQMYIWNQSTPRRDGDLDSDIVWHEYGHGLTWRMIGNMSGPMSGAIGEGMSDALSIVINNDDVVGEYSFNNPIGIRSEPYTDYSRTYGDFTGQSVHFDGEIYAAIIWDLWTRYKDGNPDVAAAHDTLLADLVGGMNFTPSGPAFEDMRDGILAQADAARDCLVWESFAAFGVGVNAQAQVRGGGPFGGGSVKVTESFDLPAECTGGGGDNPPNVSITSPADGSNFPEGALVLFEGSATDTEDGTITSNLAWESDLDGPLGSGGSFSTTLSNGTHSITASVTDSGENTVSESIMITVGPVPEYTVASVDASGQGGRNSDKHLSVTVTIDPPDGGIALAVDIENVTTGDHSVQNGTTDDTGSANFGIKNAAPGCYVTTVTSLNGNMDVATPPNQVSLQGEPCS